MAQSNSPNRGDGVTQSLQALALREVLPLRPATGSLGKRIQVATNYFTFDINPPPHAMLARYTVTVEPRAVGKKLARIIELYLEEISPNDRFANVSDFAAIILSLQKPRVNDPSVPPVPPAPLSREITYCAETWDTATADATRYRVTQNFDRYLDISDFMRQLRNGRLNEQYATRQEMIQALNIWINYHFKVRGDFLTVGGYRKFEKWSGDSKDFNTGIVARRGFFTSLRLAANSLQLNANTIHATFYPLKTLDKLVDKMKRLTNDNPLALARYISKIRVEANHLKRKKNKYGKYIVKVKTILGWASSTDGDGYDEARRPRFRNYGGPRDVTLPFEKHNRYHTVNDYSQESKHQHPATHNRGGINNNAVYQYTIRRHDLPVVNVGTKERPVYLLAEVCEIIPGQLYRHKLSSEQTSEMIAFAVRRPHHSKKLLDDKGSWFFDPVTQRMAPGYNIGAQIGKQLQENDARLLPAPDLGYHGRQKPMDDVATGSWNLRGIRKFTRCGTLDKPAILFIELKGSPSEDPAKSQIIRDLEKALRDTGIRIKSGIQLLAPAPSDSIENAFAKVAKERDFLFVVLPSEAPEKYADIKNFADRKYGIHTLCAIRRKIFETKGRAAYLANLAFKVNLKIGGSNHLVGPDNLQFIHEGRTMIVGIDVTHPSPSSSADAPSVAGMVASIDSQLGQWPGILRAQQSRQEMVADLQMMLESRLDLWKSKGGHREYPEIIIVYRDGVSEGQYHIVLDEELPLLRRACARKYAPGRQPSMTLVVVGKRHHTRFYPIVRDDDDDKKGGKEQGRNKPAHHQGKPPGKPYYKDQYQRNDDKNTDPNTDRSGNFKPGLLVDTGVTEHGLWDFYLQSHPAIQGTAKPAHYVVLLDEIFNRSRAPQDSQMNVVDKVHMMTQGLCYMFGRATRSISYCTPAYYADILCERSRRYLAKTFDGTDNKKSKDGNDQQEGLSPAQIAGFQRSLAVHPNLKDTMFYL